MHERFLVLYVELILFESSPSRALPLKFKLCRVSFVVVLGVLLSLDILLGLEVR